MVNINSIVKIMSSLDVGNEESLSETKAKSDRTAFSFDSLTTPEHSIETAQEETVPSETEVSAECSPSSESGFEFGETREAPSSDAPPAATAASEAPALVAEQEAITAKEEPQPVQHTEEAVVTNDATEQSETNHPAAPAASELPVPLAEQETITAKPEPEPVQHTEQAVVTNDTTEPSETDYPAPAASELLVPRAEQETITAKEEPGQLTEQAVVANDTTEPSETNHASTSAANEATVPFAEQETITAKDEPQPVQHTEEAVVTNDATEQSETNHLDSTTSSPSMGSVRDFAHRFSTSYRPISPSSSSSLSRKSTLMPIARSVSDGPPLPIGAVTASVRSTNPFLEELLYSIKLLTENDPTLTVLDLKDASVFTVEHGSALAAALEQNSYLKELNLCNAKVATTTASELAQALQMNSTLEVLNLESNAIGPLGMKHLAEALAVNSALLEVRLSYQKAPAGIDAEQTFANALAKNETLTKLGLQFRDPASRDACDRAIMRNKEAARRRRMTESRQ
ncbi:hypothetical protein HDU80_011598 [Chytriomyces hyalinus]|nr:hypothetical protein HDU80_011598 [Chytriomyces hyalinus]